MEYSFITPTPQPNQKEQEITGNIAVFTSIHPEFIPNIKREIEKEKEIECKFFQDSSINQIKCLDL